MGALDVCMRALNVSQTELEGPAGVALDTPLPQRYACARGGRWPGKGKGKERKGREGRPALSRHPEALL